MSFISGFEPTVTTAASEFKLGTVAQDFNGDWYQYVQADATGWAAGDAVILNPSTYVGDQATTTTSAAAAGQGFPVGVATVAFPASEYGWVKRFGAVTNLNVATGAAVATILNTTGTAGRLDDDATAGAELVEGIVTTAAEASNAAAAFLQWPRIGATIQA
ncbi:hypothetical protein JN531_001360 [Flagellatimonas centrodinii]|uniref:hypothetical protein n=1 Tax=Flagellatimonas centrodinii TaxID=2806210 RepID=UPI001FF02FFE|nr:hypothetical protein [Flagellatimonas centrodinii]ULQ46946.1 hypothetical protein JN531_001360 [Flagellatimonas centrodinii]